MNLLNENDCLIMVIDVQEKLVASVFDKTISAKVAKLVNASKILNIPLILSEQYPKGLGATVAEVSENLPEKTYVCEKTSFSLLKEDGILEKIKSYGKKQVIICGIETHICVYQTAVELINEGFEAVVMTDGCSSRKECEYKLGLRSMECAGARTASLEIILFELLRGAKHPKFKEVQALIK